MAPIDELALKCPTGGTFSLEYRDGLVRDL